MLIPRMQTSNNTNTSSRSDGEYAPFEDGKYLVEITSMEQADTQYGQPCISAELVIVGPKYANKRLWKKFHINLEENNASQKAFTQLNNIAEANGVPPDSPDMNMAQFVGWRATAMLKAGKTETGRERVNILYFESSKPDLSLASDKFKGSINTQAYGADSQDDVDLPF